MCTCLNIYIYIYIYMYIHIDRHLLFMVRYILVIKVLLKFQLDVFYLFICRLYMFRAMPSQYLIQWNNTSKLVHTPMVCKVHLKLLKMGVARNM